MASHGRGQLGAGGGNRRGSNGGRPRMELDEYDDDSFDSQRPMDVLTDVRFVLLVFLLDCN